jgi:hypothetical protein
MSWRADPLAEVESEEPEIGAYVDYDTVWPEIAQQDLEVILLVEASDNEIHRPAAIIRIHQNGRLVGKKGEGNPIAEVGAHAPLDEENVVDQAIQFLLGSDRRFVPRAERFDTQPICEVLEEIGEETHALHNK